jgi:hypothetical protein
MIIARQVFQARYGMGDEVVEICRQFAERIQESEPWMRLRVLTDLSGPFFTVVVEFEVERLAVWEHMFGQGKMQPWMGPLFSRMNELVESGSREFYRVVV